jgi:type III secretion protein J
MLRACLAVLAIVLISGCSSRLVSGIGEPEANEIVSVLNRAGLDANKKSPDGKTYEVNVSRSELTQSLQVLRSVGLPKERTTKLPDYIKKEGLVSTPIEERARLMYAIGRDLSHTLEQIDGVIQARVHVVVPTTDILGEKARPSSVSVFIRHRPGMDTVQFIPKVKQLILNGVEALTYDRITVSMFEADVLSVPRPMDKDAVALNDYRLQTGWVVLSIILFVALLISLWFGRSSFPSFRGVAGKFKIDKVSVGRGLDLSRFKRMRSGEADSDVSFESKRTSGRG